MGASFIAYRCVRLAENRDNIAYSAVSRFRCYLLRMCDMKYGTGWEEIYKDIPMLSDEPYPEWDRMIEEMDGLMWKDHEFNEVVCGTKVFTDHSDCDGSFCSEDCGFIASAFRALLDTDIVEDEHDRARMEQLAEVFEAGAEDDDCEVRIS